MKNQKGQNPTTQRAAMKMGKNSRRPIKFLKLRETRQQHMQELNSLKTERSMMLIKITDLEEKLLEPQLQIERLT